jgi:hypothetical protein
VFADLWECRDHLISNLDFWIRFVFKVTEGAREVEDTLDSVVLYESTSLLDSLFLISVVRFVVLAQGDATELPTLGLGLERKDSS